jgi:SSS family solute:Na+ symporter
MADHLDIAIVVAWNVGIVAFGCWFARRTRDPDRFMAAGRAMPGWAVGLAIFGSFVSSISFLAQPGKSFEGNWNSFVFAISMPIAAWIAVRWFVPLYRRSGEVSAYHQLEVRFGPWARTYATGCYLLLQLARTSTVMYLLAVPLALLLPGDASRLAPAEYERAIRWIIIGVGALMTVYPLMGGTEAVIWTGVVQAVVLVAGAVLCAASLLWQMPGGPGQVLETAARHHKFSLGGFEPSFVTSTFWVVLLYGIAENLRNFGVTQSYVQTYITARSDAAARRSLWLATGLFIPLAALFFFTGTALFAFYSAQPGLLPAAVADKPDHVLPFYIARLPAGLKGLIVAAICAAATDSNFNSMATLTLTDIYKRYLRPHAGDRESMWVLRLSTLACGLLCTLLAIVMIHARTILDIWWQIAGVLGGAMLGLFMLGLTCRRARGVHAAAAVVAGLCVFAWMTLSLESFSTGMLGWSWPASLAWLRCPLHGLMIPVAGTATIMFVGTVLAWLDWRIVDGAGGNRADAEMASQHR